MADTDWSKTGLATLAGLKIPITNNQGVRDSGTGGGSAKCWAVCSDGRF